ncbi:hypothetical protein [Paraburkholderia adhaesiva]|uniref:hypothetical protein n=1 Tax=Paraburkholderia adhaesiva TaxID=2883244 RepID=UPI001F28EB35|nr:hypothetical protein [Paraburkholderia adhaesiva]
MSNSLSIQSVPSGSPTINDLIQNILLYQYNPALIAQVNFNYLAEVTSGLVSIVDPSNPYVHAIEAGAVNVAAFLQKVEALNRRQYPVAAQLMSDLYTHMSDVDYVNRFATPALTTWSMIVDETELLAKLVLDPATGLKKLVIPRNTYFVVGTVQFSLQYPVVIEQMAHGGLSITYDTTIVSPLQALSSNLVTWQYRQAKDKLWIYMEFELQQFDIISRTGPCTPSKAFQLTIPVSDQFYYCRVYAQDPVTNQWIEIQVTYSTQIYDPLTPTAVVTLSTNTQAGTNQATIAIPQIYTSSGLLNQNIRVDLYETKGPLNMNLSNYAPTAFSATFLAIDTNENTIFTAPMSTFSALIVYSDQVVLGGTNAVDFRTLRQQVIDNSVGPQSIPITQAQIDDVLGAQGFGVVKNIDNITDRVFLATAPMSQPADDELITAATSTIETVTLSVADAVQNSAVIDNGTSITVTPAALYQNSNGVISMVSDSIVNQLGAMSPGSKALAITGGKYLYSPFYYVLDLTGNEAAWRPYRLDSPAVVTKLWVGENDSTGLQVSTNTYTLSCTTSGYQLVLATTSSAAYQAVDDSEVFCQLSFVPPGETSRAYLQGVLTGKTSAGERLFTFDLSTTFNVDAAGDLSLTKFLMYTTTPRLTAAALTTTFDVIYSTNSAMPPGWQKATVDSVVGTFLVPEGTVGITNEQLVLEFGQYLDTLWAQCRTVVSTLQYQTYQTNIPYYYQEDVYQIDPATGSAITIVDGEPQFTILHYKGDPVLNPDGTPSYQFRVGDVILINGNPVPVNPRSVSQELDIMMIDAVYRFATDSVAPAYVEQLLDTVVGWLTGEFETFNDNLLENTSLYYYPVANMGSVQVWGPDGILYNIDAAQSFQITCLVSPTVFANDSLKQQLQTITISTIDTQLKGDVVSMSAITTALNEVYGNDVISFVASGLGGPLNLNTITLVDRSTQLGIAKQLVANADGTLSVKENVIVSFISYSAQTR